MDTKTPDWNKEQYLCYVLLYAAFADQVMTDEESDHIIDQVGEDYFEDVLEEFEDDTDFERSQKLIAYSQGEDFDQEYAKMVKNEMIDLFMSDGQYTQWEKAIWRALVRLMNL
jgi:hypothetical protein